MLRAAVLILPCLAMGACTGFGPNPPLASGASPASVSNLNQEPQSENSLPPGAEGLNSTGPNGKAPNYVGATFKPF